MQGEAAVKRGTKGRFDKRKKLLHNLVSLLNEQHAVSGSGSTGNTPAGVGKTRCFAGAGWIRSLTTKQPISVGAWNECAAFSRGFAKFISSARTNEEVRF